MGRVKAKASYDENALKDCIIAALQNKKAKKLVELDLTVLGAALFDKFIICTATSSTHAEALQENVCVEVKQKLKILPSHVEGVGNSQWILIDYFDIMVHIFLEETRSFYDLESLWADANTIEYKDEE